MAPKTYYINAYPFGSVLGGRNGNTSVYRFSINGQEKVDEISGAGNHTTAQYWEYDTRLGRRWNLDPVIKNHESPYACFSNNPIIYIDKNGDDSEYYDSETGEYLGTIKDNLAYNVAFIKKADYVIAKYMAEYISMSSLGMVSKDIAFTNYVTDANTVSIRLDWETSKATDEYQPYVRDGADLDKKPDVDCYMAACTVLGSPHETPENSAHTTDNKQAASMQTMIKGLSILSEELNEGDQVLLGIDYLNYTNSANAGWDSEIDHWTVGVQLGHDDEKGAFILVTDNGYGSELFDKSLYNRFYIRDSKSAKILLNGDTQFTRDSKAKSKQSNNQSTINYVIPQKEN